MSSTKQTTHLSFAKSGTDATAFHLSDTLDWSSTATCIKNRVFIVPAYKKDQPNIELEKRNSPKKDVTNLEI